MSQEIEDLIARISNGKIVYIENVVAALEHINKKLDELEREHHRQGLELINIRIKIGY